MFFPLISLPMSQRVEAVILQRGRAIALGMCASAWWQSLTLWNPSSIWPNSCFLLCPTAAALSPPFHSTSWWRSHREKPLHPHIPVPLNCLWVCWLAGSLCCRLLKEHPSLMHLRNSLVFLWMVCLKLREKHRCFIYYSHVFCEWWKVFIYRWPFTLMEKLFFTLFRICLSNFPCLRCFACPLIPGTLHDPGT